MLRLKMGFFAGGLFTFNFTFIMCFSTMIDLWEAVWCQQGLRTAKEEIVKKK